MTRSARRHGITVIDLLVLMVIAGILMALLLPAVLSARSASRRMQCTNNLRNLGLAVIQTAEIQGRFPVAGYWGPPGQDGPYHNWVVQILWSLDQKTSQDSWNSGVSLMDPANQRIANLHLSVLVCPDDITRTGQGDLSYVVNGGIGWTDLSCFVETRFGGIDLNANGRSCGMNTLVQEDGAAPTDRDYMHQMGLFFVDNWPLKKNSPIRHHNLDSVVDGVTHTIMITENVHAGADPINGSGFANWASPEPWRSMFFLSPLVCDKLVCGPGAVNYSQGNNRSDDQFRIAAINFLPHTNAPTEGKLPWPSAYHAGGVHVVFVDGRVHFLSEQIEGHVYAALLSPQGTRIRGPLAQQDPTNDH